MNIFVISEDPVEAARSQCDKHVVKMVTESAQMLNNAYESKRFGWSHAHVGHPCSVWTRASRANYEWHLLHALALSDEYTARYQKIHDSSRVIELCAENFSSLTFPMSSLTPFARAMWEPWKSDTSITTVEAYRYFYIAAKSTFARWRFTAPPIWFPRELL